MSFKNHGDFMQIEPYLFFSGRADEALSFYSDVLGAKVEMVLRYQDSPDPIPPGTIPPGYESKVMHASIMIDGQRLMLSDGCDPTPSDFRGFTLSLTVPTVAEAEQLFARLEAGGQVQMPLKPTFFSPMFGMVADRFGVSWMVLVESAEQTAQG